MKNLLFAFFAAILLAANLFSQGKIITKQEADGLFGKVLISKEIPTTTLLSLTESSVKIIMFKIIENDVYILSENRKVLLPAGNTVNETDIFSVYSTNIVRELFVKGNMPTTIIEQRNDVLTLTNGNYTLEFAIKCPPICF